MGMNENERHWLAGMYEGEGCFMQGPPSKPNVPRTTLVSTDRDTIEKVANLVPGSIIAWMPSQHAHHKDKWRVELHGPRAVAFMQDIRPLMGTRRRAAIDSAIASYRPKTRTRLVVELGLESLM